MLYQVNIIPMFLIVLMFFSVVIIPLIIVHSEKTQHKHSTNTTQRTLQDHDIT